MAFVTAWDTCGTTWFTVLCTSHERILSCIQMVSTGKEHTEKYHVVAIICLHYTQVDMKKQDFFICPINCGGAHWTLLV